MNKKKQIVLRTRHEARFVEYYIIKTWRQISVIRVVLVFAVKGHLLLIQRKKKHNKKQQQKSKVMFYQMRLAWFIAVEEWIRFKVDTRVSDSDPVLTQVLFFQVESESWFFLWFWSGPGFFPDIRIRIRFFSSRRLDLDPVNLNPDSLIVKGGGVSLDCVSGGCAAICRQPTFCKIFLFSAKFCKVLLLVWLRGRGGVGPPPSCFHAPQPHHRRHPCPGIILENSIQLIFSYLYRSPCWNAYFWQPSNALWILIWTTFFVYFYPERLVVV